MKIFENNLRLIEKSMDLRIKRHAVLSSNVANSETPNYRAREVNFAGELKQALGNKSETITQTNSRHLDISSEGQSHVVIDRTSAVGADGNSVDLDLMMGRLAENSRAYQNAASLLGIQLRLLKTAARGRTGF